MSGELPELLHFAHLLTGNRSSAEDLVQTALMKLLQAWPRLVAGIDFHPDAYARKVIINTSMSSWRQWTSRVQIGKVPEQSVTLASWEDGYDLARLMAKLPVRQRTVLVLRYYLGYSETEIAEVLGCRPGTVKSAAARGLATLRRKLVPAAPLNTPEVTT